MTQYYDELQRGQQLAAAAAAASTHLDAQSRRIAAAWPVPPQGDPAGEDGEYRAAAQQELQASQRFWSWVKTHSVMLTDHDLGGLMRELTGHPVQDK